MDIVVLAVLLILMLIAGTVLTNVLEHFGELYNIKKGFLGSVIAAVSTALPESMVPIMAFFAKGASVLDKQEIIVGAILGPQLMLATLAIAVLAIAAWMKRGWWGVITPIFSVIRRDLNYFAFTWLVAFASIFIPSQYFYIRLLCGLTLLTAYGRYIYITYHSGSASEQHQEELISEPLILHKLGVRNFKWAIFLQLILSLGLLLVVAKLFVHEILLIAEHWQISPLLIALILLPIATELPEKFNGIIWIRKNQDTLAIGNVTGAMVFQASILPVLGINLQSWQPNPAILLNMIITGLALVWLYVNLRTTGFKIYSLLILALLYGLYCYGIFHILTH